MVRSHSYWNIFNNIFFNSSLLNFHSLLWLHCQDHVIQEDTISISFGEMLPKNIVKKLWWNTNKYDKSIKENICWVVYCLTNPDDTLNIIIPMTLPAPCTYNLWIIKIASVYNPAPSTHVIFKLPQLFTSK